MANSALKCQIIVLITARSFCSYNNILINFGHLYSNSCYTTFSIATLGSCIACEFHQLWAVRPCIYQIFRHLTKWLTLCRIVHACTVHPNLIKENRRMWTCNRLDLQSLGSQPVIMPKNLPDNCLETLGFRPIMPQKSPAAFAKNIDHPIGFLFHASKNPKKHTWSPSRPHSSLFLGSQVLLPFFIPFSEDGWNCTLLHPSYSWPIIAYIYREREREKKVTLVYLDNKLE